MEIHLLTKKVIKIYERFMKGIPDEGGIDSYAERMKEVREMVSSHVHP